MLFKTEKGVRTLNASGRGVGIELSMLSNDASAFQQVQSWRVEGADKSSLKPSDPPQLPVDRHLREHVATGRTHGAAGCSFLLWDTIRMQLL